MGDLACTNQDAVKAIETTVTQSWPNIPFRMSFEGELPVFKDRNISKTKLEDRKDGGPSTNHIVDFFFFFLAGICCFEIRSFPFDSGRSYQLC